MKLNEDVGELSTRGKAALVGAMVLCCLIPMLVLGGAVSVAGAAFGGIGLVVAGALAIGAMALWMSNRHRAGDSCHATGEPAQETPGGGAPARR